MKRKKKEDLGDKPLKDLTLNDIITIIFWLAVGYILFAILLIILFTIFF